MKEFDLFVPLFSNDGKRLPRAGLARVKKRLIKKFGGLTHFPQKSKGTWKVGAATFVDDIVILRVLSEKDTKDFWKKLKADLQREWKQKNILIVVRKVSLV